MPKSKLFEDWSAGVDRRRDRSMTDAGALWNVKNAYIDNGGRIRQRPAISKAGDMTNCDGLVYLNGFYYCFGITGAVPTPAVTSSIGVGLIVLPAGPGGQTTIKRVWFASQFGGTYYVVIEFSDGVISHYWNGARVIDVNCPNTTVVTVAGNRVWCADYYGRVRYSQLNDGSQWTTGAGFLLARDQAPGMGNVVTALGIYQSDVVFFFENGAQVWYPDVDPTKMFLRQRLFNVGVNPIAGPRCTVPFGEDLAFLGQDGVRSLSVSQSNGNRIEQDLGAPVRDLPVGNVTQQTVAPFTYSQTFPAGNNLIVGADPVDAYFNAALSQVHFCFSRLTDRQDPYVGTTTTNEATDRTAILAMSYGNKRQSWSLYNIPARSKNWLPIANGALFLRNTNAAAPFNPQIWALNDTVPTDYDAAGNAVPFTVEIAWPLLDMDAPGAMKNFKGMDWVCWPLNRNSSISFLYDANDESKQTIAQTIPNGDTRGKGMIAVEVSAVNLAPIVNYTTVALDTARYRFSGLQLYYDEDAGAL